MDKGKGPSKVKKKKEPPPPPPQASSPPKQPKGKNPSLAEAPPAGEEEKKKKSKREKVQPNAVEKPLPKDLKSSPLYQRGIAALMAKVRGRKKSRSESISLDEIMYPSAERKGRGKKLAKSDEQNEPGQSTLLMYDTCAEISTMVGVKQARLTHSGMPVVAGNNCNDNKLFINDMPFWWSDEVSDITDDELVMNASVLIDALEGRLKLVPMPDVQIVLDPIEDVTILQTRDKLCFKKEHIFGNTVRSMVNLNAPPCSTNPASTNDYPLSSLNHLLEKKHLNHHKVKIDIQYFFDQDSVKFYKRDTEYSPSHWLYVEQSIRSLRSSKKARKLQKRLDIDRMHPLEMVEPTMRTMYARDNFKEMYAEDYTPEKTIRYQYDPPVAELEHD